MAFPIIESDFDSSEHRSPENREVDNEWSQNPLGLKSNSKNFVTEKYVGRQAAYWFDGSSSYIDLNLEDEHMDFLPAGNDWAITFSFRTEEVDVEQVLFSIAVDDTNNNTKLIIYIDVNNRLQIGYGDGASYDKDNHSATLEADTDYELGLIYSESVRTNGIFFIYLNEVWSQIALTQGFWTGTVSHKTHLGCHHGTTTNNFSGWIWDFRIFTGDNIFKKQIEAFYNDTYTPKTLDGIVRHVVGFYPLDDNSSDNQVLDFSYRRKHGVLNNVVGGTATLNASGYSDWGDCLDGSLDSDEVVVVENFEDEAGEIFEHDKAFSVAYMTYIGASYPATGYMYSTRDSVNTDGVNGLVYNTGNIGYFIRYSASTAYCNSSSSELVLDSWNFVVNTFDGSSNQLGMTSYLNGLQVAIGSTSLAITSIEKNNLNLMALYENGSVDADAKVQYITIFDKELTANEVSELYQTNIRELLYYQALQSLQVAHYPLTSVLTDETPAATVDTEILTSGLQVYNGTTPSNFTLRNQHFAYTDLDQSTCTFVARYYHIGAPDGVPASGYAPLLEKGDATTTNWLFGIEDGAGTYAVAIDGAEVHDSLKSFSTDRWYYIITTLEYDGSSDHLITSYIYEPADGTLTVANDTTTIASWDTTSRNLNLGWSEQYTSTVNGILRDVGLYSFCFNRNQRDKYFDGQLIDSAQLMIPCDQQWSDHRVPCNDRGIYIKPRLTNINNGLIGYWPLQDNAANSLVEDVSSRNINGNCDVNTSIIDATGYVDSSCFNFNLQIGGHYVTVSNFDTSNEYFAPGLSWTINFWSELDSTNTHPAVEDIIGNKYYGTDQGWVISALASDIVFGVTDTTNYFYEKFTMTHTGWAMFTIVFAQVYNADHVRLYINAEQKATISSSSSATNLSGVINSNTLIMGADYDHTGNLLEKKLEQMMIFNRVLHPQEIRELYYGGKGIVDSMVTSPYYGNTSGLYSGNATHSNCELKRIGE